MSKVDVFKKRLYEIIEASKENDIVSQAYDIMMLVAVIVGLLPLTMKSENIYTKWIDWITVILFIIDYGFRIYTADYKMGVKSYKAYIAYILSPMAIIDLISIIPVVAFLVPQSLLMRIIKVLKVLRVLKLIRYSKTMVSISNVLRRVKRQLLAVLVLTLIYIFASALIVFQIEPSIFDTFFDALYWSTISITTIGYGDISPVTDLGRFITMLSALVGVAIIALPSGIITAAYMEEIKKKKSKLEL